MRPFAVSALVPHKGQVVPIKFRSQVPGVGWAYTIHTRKPDRELVVDFEVPHAVIVASIGAFAHYSVGQTVLIKGRYPMLILHRRWSFRQGTVIYQLSKPGLVHLVEKTKMGTRGYTQENLFRMVEADDVPEQFQRPGKWDLEFMM